MSDNHEDLTEEEALAFRIIRLLDAYADIDQPVKIYVASSWRNPVQARRWA